jgi:hypothetical protein
MLFVGERRRSRRLPGAIRSERSEQIKQRIARRRAEEEGADMLFVGERRRSRRLPGAIRSERSSKSNTARAAHNKSAVLVFELEVCDDRARS